MATGEAFERLGVELRAAREMLGQANQLQAALRAAHEPNRARPNFDLASEIMKFDGEDPDMVDHFFEVVEGVGLLCNWTNEGKLVITKLKLAGKALKFILSERRETTSNYDNLKRALVERFRDKAPWHEYYHELFTLRQKDGEAIEDFADRIKAINAKTVRTTECAEANAALQEEADARALNIFVRGLGGKIGENTRLAFPTTFHEAIAKAKAIAYLPEPSISQKHVTFQVNEVRDVESCVAPNPKLPLGTFANGDLDRKPERDSWQRVRMCQATSRSSGPTTSGPRQFRTLRKQIRVVPELGTLVDELVAIGKIEDAEGKVLIDTGAQVSLIKRGASSAPLRHPDVILKGISGRTLKVYGRQEVSLMLKPGVPVRGSYVVGNLPKGYLAVLGCDILNRGQGRIDIEHGLLTLGGKQIWLNRMTKGEVVPDPRRPPVQTTLEQVRPGTAKPPSERNCRPAPLTTERYVYACANEVIPARSEKLLRVKLSKFKGEPEGLEGIDVMIEPIGLTAQGVYLARTCTKVLGSRCWVKAVNVSEEEVPLPVNTKVGVLEELCEPDKLNTSKRKIVLLADSHGRGLQELLAERLPSEVAVTSWFCPNGKLKHIVAGIGKELAQLTQDDMIVVIGGTNDVDRYGPYMLTIHQAFQALPASWTAKVVFVSVFDRHDVNICKDLREAHDLIERLVQLQISKGRGPIECLDVRGKLTRAHYTKHGLHLNPEGKLVLAEQLRVLILQGGQKPTRHMRAVQSSWTDNDERTLLQSFGEKLTKSSIFYS